MTAKRFTLVLVLTLLATLALPLFAQTQNPNPAVTSQENATEKASGINDKVDIVNGPNVTPTSANTASLTWTTNNTAATRVVYGTDPNNMSQHAYVPGGSRDHTAQLKNLQAGATYYYAIEDDDGRRRYQGQFQAGSSTTAAPQAPGAQVPPGVSANEAATEKASGISDKVDLTGEPQVQTAGNTAVLSWTTNNNSATRVVYGTDPNNMNQKAYTPGGTRNHQVQLTGLQPGQTYHYAIEDNDGRARYKGAFVAK
ncbi:MAG TPA: fibronectin type III domain-containing protein [Terriglobales bacterium]|nr:fibronectin type III domain-containing protein [Terriglobales bacterium]